MIRIKRSFLFFASILLLLLPASVYAATPSPDDIGSALWVTASDSPAPRGVAQVGSSDDDGNDDSHDGDDDSDGPGDGDDSDDGSGSSSTPPPVSGDQYIVIGWNDLGMHCMDPTFEDFSVLPPYNTLWAQVIKRGASPQIVTSGVTVEYSFVDNTNSATKTNFWDTPTGGVQYAQKLFDLPGPLPANTGLTGKGLTGEMDPSTDHFVAEGIPLTEFRDSAPTTPYPYQVAELVVKDTGGTVLATTQTVAPVSTEMNCVNCHDDGGTANPGISTGVMKQNILTLHDNNEGTSLMANRPVLCASCHSSNALGTPGINGVPNLSLAMHGQHKTATNDCEQCHPGPQTKCFRGTMAEEGMNCQNCHGNMSDVANASRNPWLDEPRCETCHGASHGENPNKLYRFSTGHGGVYCQACHGSQHAIYPSLQPNDNLQSILLQGEAGTIEKCAVCHTSTPSGSGPHGEEGNDDDGDGEDGASNSSGDIDNGEQVGDSYKRYGYITTAPAGTTGTWEVDARAYTADTSTRFEQEHGSLSVGQCVEIKFVAGTKKLLEMQSESSYKCGGSSGGSTPGISYRQYYGTLATFPTSLIGPWVVDSNTYTATTATRMEQENGPFFAGGCVEVKFQAGSTTAVEINTESAEKCLVSGGSPAEGKLYGLVDTIPADVKNGNWVIAGTAGSTTTVIAIPTTVISEEHGGLTVGSCAEVEYQGSNGNYTATRIGSEPAYKCNADGVTFENKVLGYITTFPANLVGSWVLDSGNSYYADGSAQFKQTNGAFGAGQCVSLKYYPKNGVHYITEVETESNSDCAGTGTGQVVSSKIFATIGSFPSAPHLGSWTIGGTVYTATSTTRFEQGNGAFAVDACVKANYSSGNNLLKVETEDAYKCQVSQSDTTPAYRGYGAIEAMPSDTLTGTWRVSGIEYQTSGATTFEQNHGFFSVGAYVEVKYTSSGGVNTALSIETHVEPGSGRTSVAGTLDSRPTDDWGDWVVDGVTYKSDPAIEVDDTVATSSLSTMAAPVLGETVLLNTYSSGGDTFVTYAAAGKLVYLPIILH